MTILANLAAVAPTIPVSRPSFLPGSVGYALYPSAQVRLAWTRAYISSQIDRLGTPEHLNTNALLYGGEGRAHACAVKACLAREARPCWFILFFCSRLRNV